MPPSTEPKETESKESKAARRKEWKPNTWDAEHVTYICLPVSRFKLTRASKIIASSKDMIEVVNTRLGKNGKIFSAAVHKELLCFFSAYYTAALKGGFSEAKKNCISMELPCDQMQDLVSWLYSGKILSCTTSPLLKLYVFADEKMMLALRRSIMTRLIYCQDQALDAIRLSDAMPCLKVLPERSGLFRYLVDFWVSY